MITYYCPACWKTIAPHDEQCPFCGFDLGSVSDLPFEQKLIRALEHPVPEKRMLAIQILGELRSRAALPGLEKLLKTETKDIYVLMEVVIALSKIQDPHSQELLKSALLHPFEVIRNLAERLIDHV